jgi:hypothetical protein
LQQLIQTHVLGLKQLLAVIGSHLNIDNALHQVALTNAKSISEFLTKHASFICIAGWHASWSQFHQLSTTTNWHAENRATVNLLSHVMALPATRLHWCNYMIAGRHLHLLYCMFRLAVLLVKLKIFVVRKAYVYTLHLFLFLFLFLLLLLHLLLLIPLLLCPLLILFLLLLFCTLLLCPLRTHLLLLILYTLLFLPLFLFCLVVQLVCITLLM